MRLYPIIANGCIGPSALDACPGPAPCCEAALRRLRFFPLFLGAEKLYSRGAVTVPRQAPPTASGDWRSWGRRGRGLKSKTCRAARFPSRASDCCCRPVAPLALRSAGWREKQRRAGQQVGAKRVPRKTISLIRLRDVSFAVS